ncbi:MAG: hypothetical protein PVG11_00165, partial [Anaerolineae bacterium]
EKNRQRAFWGLAIVAFMSLVSLILILTGLFGSGGVLWVPVWLGVVGLLGFGVSAAMIVRTLRAPWHLALHPGGLRLHTPMYVLDVPWGQVTGIGVDEVSFREGVVLVFDDPAEVVSRADFYMRSSRPDLISDRATMLARMEENFEALGYHLGIPGRILEMGPQELAELLARARRGGLWEAEG